MEKKLYRDRRKQHFDLGNDLVLGIQHTMEDGYTTSEVQLEIMQLSSFYPMIGVLKESKVKCLGEWELVTLDMKGLPDLEYIFSLKKYGLADFEATSNWALTEITGLMHSLEVWKNTWDLSLDTMKHSLVKPESSSGEA